MDFGQVGNSIAWMLIMIWVPIGAGLLVHFSNKYGKS